ncbi:MAG TPA: hypothetical protein ENJ39_03465 [Flammeovirgaceae bacterium]|nr:hypothetical protein [Flammeovirgaceae bacterium]
MKEFEEDNLENFFRKRAGVEDYPFNEADWARLEERLDALDAAGGMTFGKYFWMAVGAALTSLMFITYLYFFTPPVRPPATTTGLVESPSPVQQPAGSAPQSADQPIAADSRTVGGSLATVSKPAPQVAQRKQSKKHVTLADSGTAAMPANRQESRDVVGNQPVAGIGHARQEPISAGQPPTGYRTDGQQESAVGGTARQQQPSVTAPPTSLYHFSLSHCEPAYPYIRKKENPKPEVHTRRFYTVGISLAADVSTTAQSAWGPVIPRIGLTGEYFVNDRLSVGLGVSVSNKKYSAKGREYQPPKGFWTNGVVPDSTNAQCRILEVPLTVNWYQPLSRRSQLVVRGGLSSWFMLREDYWYKYSSNNPDLVQWWGGSNENRYWFGIAHLSLGYEFMITPRWSVLAGPYINIPLTGVGHGNVALRNFGFKGAFRLNRYRLK